MKQMRIGCLFFTLIGCLIQNNSTAQIIFIQPNDSKIKKNILFGKHKHYFKIKEKGKLLSITSSIGKISEVTDSSFKYFVNAPISSGKVNFNVAYTLKNIRTTETLVYEFVPKTRYSFKVVTHLGKKTTLRDLNELDIHFIFYYDNAEINVDLECMTLVYANKRGEMPSPIICCKTNGVVRIKECIRRFVNLPEEKFINGDRFYFASPVFQHNGKRAETQLSFELRF